MALQLTVAVALGPDHALQGLQRRRLAILGDPLQEDRDHPLDIGVRLTALGTHRRQLCGYLGLSGVFADEVRQVPGGIGKQHVENEADRAGGAFDVGEDGFDGHADSG